MTFYILLALLLVAGLALIANPGLLPFFFWVIAAVVLAYSWSVNNARRA